MYKPIYTITGKIIAALLQIETAKQSINNLITQHPELIIDSDRMKLAYAHYSSRIGGNQLSYQETSQVIFHGETTPGTKRERQDVVSLYEAINFAESIAKHHTTLTESLIADLHHRLCGDEQSTLKIGAYRGGQNILMARDSEKTIYLPPKAKIVTKLMSDLIAWLAQSRSDNLVCPLRACIAHYQLTTIHPYYQGNGRLARLLSLIILNQGGYFAHNLYCLDEYFAQDKQGYYSALDVGESNNYDLGRANADITDFVEYFCNKLALAISKAEQNLRSQAANKDPAELYRALNEKQRRTLALFQDNLYITAPQVANLFNVKPRTARDWCQQWVNRGLLEISDPSNKARCYRLGERYQKLIDADAIANA